MKSVRKWIIALACACVWLSSVVRAGDVEVFAISPLDLRADNAIPKEWSPSDGPIQLRVAAGRIGDVALAVTGRTRMLHDVRLLVSPLVGPGGQTIIVPEERIRTVVCTYRPKGGLGGPADWDARDSYDYQPYLLMYNPDLIQVDHKRKRTRVKKVGPVPDFLDDTPPLKARHVPAKEIRQWYIMVPVPEHGTQAGDYKGTIQVLSRNAIVATVPLEVTVLPFKPLPPAKLYGIYENLTLSGMSIEDPRYKLMLEDLAEAGIHNPWLTAGADRVRTKDGWHVSFAQIEKAIELRYAAGMDMDFAVLVWSGSGINLYEGKEPEHYEALARKLRAWWDIRGFPGEPVIYGVDEASGEALREHAACYAAMNRAGVKVSTACAAGYFSDAGESVQYPIIAGGMHPDDPTVADVARARATGATVLNYNEPQLIYHDPLQYRVRAGFDLWTNVYDGWYPFTYAWGFNEDHRMHRAITKGGGVPFKTHGVVVVGKDRMIPQVEWPAVRQGIDDVRYATTLAAQLLVAEEKGILHDLVAEGEHLLRNHGVRADDWRTVDAARKRVVDMILALEKANPALRVATIARGDTKALAKRVNAWILPDLSFRPFPMGIPALAEKLAQLKSQAKANPVDAMFAGLEAKNLVREARAQKKINPVETVVAMGHFGDLIMQTEIDGLTADKPKDGGLSPLEKNFNIVRDLNTGWVFQPDRGNDGIKEKWFLPEYGRTNWSPIDVTKFWQRQGRTDWQDLEGSRVGMEGIGWYALTLDVPKEWVGKTQYLWFICDEEAIVWVNGKEVRTRNEGSNILRWKAPALAPLQGLTAGKNTIIIRVVNMALAGGLWNAVRVVERK